VLRSPTPAQALVTYVYSTTVTAAISPTRAAQSALTTVQITSNGATGTSICILRNLVTFMVIRPGFASTKPFKAIILLLTSILK